MISPIRLLQTLLAFFVPLIPLQESMPISSVSGNLIVLLLLTPVLHSSVSTQVKWSPRHVDTKMGVVQGFVFSPGKDQAEVEVILNLPYASPPTGSLRFMPPVSGSPWSGVRRSERPGPVCPQVLPDLRNETEVLKTMPKGAFSRLLRILPHLTNQSEDCLYLNLYAPLKVAEGKLTEKLPVLLFVGDDFTFGSGNIINPSMLVSYGNIIAITLNYRLGILGFLNANSDSHFRLPYNFALLDQIAALQWIQENVALFGGDRFNVTLMGHGKGAVLVNFLMVSSAVPTGLLFHRVILASGSALSPLASDLSSGPELSKRFATKVRCPPEPSATMLECLREVPLKLFLESELWSLFGPTADGIVVKGEAPSDAVIMNKGSHYPLLFGVVKAEALPSLGNQDASYGIEGDRRREILRQFINKYYRYHRSEILAGAIHEYTDWEKPVQHPQNVMEQTLNALGDAQVVAPMTKVGDLISQSSRSRAYFYVFDYQSKSSEYQQRLGCVHGEDLLYIFGAPVYFYEAEESADLSVNSEMRSDISGGDYVSERARLGIFAGNFTWHEVQLSLTVMRLWANFVRFGNPNGDSRTSVPGKAEAGNGHHRSSHIQVQDSAESRPSRRRDGHWELPDWPQYESLDKKYLVLDLRPRVKSHYRAHKLSFWLHLVPDYQTNEDGITLITSPHHGVDLLSISTSSKERVGSGSPGNLSAVVPLVASGLYDLSQDQDHKRKTHNSSQLSPKSTNVIRSPNSTRNPTIHQEQHQQDSGGGESPLSSSGFDFESESDSSSFFGLHHYSTALSVTVAIGLSLLILNVLIFATFYYEREKRLQALRKSQQEENAEVKMSIPMTMSCTSTTQMQMRDSATMEGSCSSTLARRRKENGGILEKSSFFLQPDLNLHSFPTQEEVLEEERREEEEEMARMSASTYGGGTVRGNYGNFPQDRRCCPQTQQTSTTMTMPLPMPMPLRRRGPNDDLEERGEFAVEVEMERNPSFVRGYHHPIQHPYFHRLPLHQHQDVSTNSEGDEEGGQSSSLCGSVQ